MKVVFEGKTKSEIEMMNTIVEDMSVVKVAVDRDMAACRWHESFCMDDDCRNSRHPMSVPCDSDAPLSEICGKCGDFEAKFENNHKWRQTCKR